VWPAGAGTTALARWRPADSAPKDGQHEAVSAGAQEPAQEGAREAAQEAANQTRHILLMC